VFGGVRRYVHSDPVQVVTYNHVTGFLASGACTDVGLWDPEVSTVTRKPVTAKVLSASWSKNGQFLALGQFNGQISIRTKDGSECAKIERKAPIWSLAWNPGRSEKIDILAVADWDQTLSFYQLSGHPVAKDRHLGFDPCSIQYLDNGQYFLLAGSDRSVTLWTKEGVKLGQALSGPQKHSSWVWQAAPMPTITNGTRGSQGGSQSEVDTAAAGFSFATACNDGHVSMHEVSFNTVHAFYQDKYAHRDYMTDVVVQDLGMCFTKDICRGLLPNRSSLTRFLIVQSRKNAP
jgi:intraflagellar transport protein 122